MTAPANEAVLYVILGELLPSAPLRNAPLAAIGAQYRHRDAKDWKTVLSKYHIAKASYNQLGGAWTDFDAWRAPRPTA